MEKTMREHMKNRFGGDANFSEKPPLPKSLNIEMCILPISWRKGLSAVGNNYDEV